MKHYRSNEEGREKFTKEVILPLVLNEGHFVHAEYENTDRGEYIMLYRREENQPAHAINITGDTIESMIRFFMLRFINCIEAEVAIDEYNKKF